MTNMNYRDIPVLQATGWNKPEWSAVSWFKGLWQAWEEEDTGMLMFAGPNFWGMMNREQFDEQFGRMVDAA